MFAARVLFAACLIARCTFAAPPTIESIEEDLFLSSGGRIALASSSGQVDDVVSVIQSMQKQLSSCVKIASDSGQVTESSSTLTVPIGVVTLGNGNTVDADFAINGCDSTGTMAFKVQVTEGRVTSTSTGFGGASKLSSVATVSMESSGETVSLWLSLDASDVCSTGNFKGASWSFSASASGGGSVAPLAQATPGDQAVNAAVLELALMSEMEAIARDSERDVLEVEGMVKDAAEKAGGLEDSIAAVTGAAAGNADTLVTVSDKIVEISEDLSALNNHALAECTPPKVDNSKVSRKGNVLAGTHVTYTCNDGTFNSKGDKAPTVTLFCPGGGGELTEGVVPQCDKCDSACTKCGDTADTCTACSAKGQVPVEGGRGCIPELGTKSNPANSCKQILDSHTKDTGATPKSGLYYIEVEGADAYQAWCDMVLDGGGWEVVWKQAGGLDHPGASRIVSTRSMQLGGSRTEYVKPPIEDDQDTHGSGMAAAYETIIKTKGLELLRVATVWQSRDGAPKSTQLIRFGLGTAITLATLYTKPTVDRSQTSACVDLPNTMTLFYSPSDEKETTEIGKARQVIHFAVHTGDSVGLPNTANNGADKCGDDEWAKETDKLGRVYSREDGGDGRNTVRHLLGYDGARATAMHSVRCSSCCWPSSRSICTGIYETHHFMIRPQQ